MDATRLESYALGTICTSIHYMFIICSYVHLFILCSFYVHLYILCSSYVHLQVYFCRLSISVFAFSCYLNLSVLRFVHALSAPSLLSFLLCLHRSCASACTRTRELARVFTCPSMTVAYNRSCGSPPFSFLLYFSVFSIHILFLSQLIK